jgi:hypothetical protein
MQKMFKPGKIFVAIELNRSASLFLGVKIALEALDLNSRAL